MENRSDFDKPASGDARQRVREEAEQLAEHGKERAESLKSRLGEEAGRTASALGAAAGELDAEGQQKVAELLAEFSRNLGDFAHQVQHKSLDELLQDGSRLAQRNPVLFIAGSVAAGAVLSRFFKARDTSRRPRHTQHAGTAAQDARTQVDARAGVTVAGPSAEPGRTAGARSQAEARSQPGARSPGSGDYRTGKPRTDDPFEGGGER
jgi:hypothetical protein